MEKENIRSPEQKSTHHWTKDEMREAQPYPLPEVPPEAEPAPHPKPPATPPRGRGRTLEGGRPEVE